MRGSIAATLLVLSACGQADAPQTDTEDASAAGALAIADIAATRAGDPVEDQLITCKLENYDGKQGITITQPFVIKGGEVKRYSDFENTVFDLCQPGQEGCALGWKGDDIAMVYTAPNGTVTATTLSLDDMSVTEQTAKAGEALRTIAADATCTAAPLPADAKIIEGGSAQ